MEKVAAAYYAALNWFKSLAPNRRIGLFVGIAATIVIITIIGLIFNSRNRYLSEFNEDCLRAHNALREKHQADSLTFDEDLADFALEHAKTLARDDEFKHSNSSFGENLYWSSDFSQDSCKSVVDKWYQEKQDWFYRSGSGHPYRVTGHFTQVVWRATQRVGCARHDKGDGKYQGVFVVCEYDPPGNNGGRTEYKKNVMPPMLSKTRE